MGLPLSATTWHLQAILYPQARVSILDSSLSLCEHTMMEAMFLDKGDSDTDDTWDLVDGYSGGPHTPSTISEQPEDEGDSQPHQTSHGDRGSEEEQAFNVPRRKKGGYDSRIEQILHENPDLPIMIVDAGKSSESGGKYIVYTIRTGVRARKFVLAGSS